MSNIGMVNVIVCNGTTLLVRFRGVTAPVLCDMWELGFIK